MGDLGEYWRDVNAYFGQRRCDNQEANKKVLADFGIPFRDVGNSTVLIRIDEVPKIDFYLTKNKWKVVENKRVKYIQGDSKSFVNWFMKRYKEFI